MSRKPVSIPLSGEPQGILVENGGSYRFVAVRFDAFALDGRAFSSIEEADRVILDLITGDADAESEGLVA